MGPCVRTMRATQNLPGDQSRAKPQVLLKYDCINIPLSKEVGTTQLKTNHFLSLQNSPISKLVFGTNVLNLCLKAKSFDETLLGKSFQNMCFMYAY